MEFIIWLNAVGRGSKVVLVAYNGLRFDAKILLSKIIEFKLKKEFTNICIGFVDPFVMVKELYPNCPKKGQDAMMNHFKLHAKHEDQTHNAILDCNDLRRLTKKIYQEQSKKNPSEKSSQARFCMRYFQSIEDIAAENNAACVLS